MRRFRDRDDAGQALAARLLHYAGRPDVIVLALPRGGVPVGYAVARALHAPLDVVIVRKLGVPGYPELAMGAIAGGKVCVLNRDLLRELRIEGEAIDRVIAEERQELRRREREYRGDRPAPHVAGKTVVLVDDGLATGATMFAAVTAIQRQHAAEVVVAAPVASREAAAELAAAGCVVVTVMTPESFVGVGGWYEDFSQTSDAEVRVLLEAARRNHAIAPSVEPRDPAPGAASASGDRPTLRGGAQALRVRGQRRALHGDGDGE